MHEILSRYVLERDIRPGSIQQLRYSLDNFGQFLERSPAVTDFSDEVVNRFILWLTEKKYARETIRTRRSGIMALWNAAADAGEVPPPRKVRKLAPHRSVPRAWTPDQVAAILAECKKLTGTFRRHRHIERAKFAAAVAMVCYETGFRRGDVLRIHRHQIQPCGLIVLIQSKTGQPHLARIRPETIQMIDAMGTTGRPHVFGGVVSTRWLGKLVDRVCKAAGIPEGSVKWWRRSGATHVEKASPGTGYLYLGHTTPRVAFQSYLDPLQLKNEAIQPPELPPDTKSA